MFKWILFDLLVHLTLATLAAYSFMCATGIPMTSHNFLLCWAVSGLAVMVIDHSRGKRLDDEDDN